MVKVRIGKKNYNVDEDVAREIERLRKCESVAEFSMKDLTLDQKRLLAKMALDDAEERGRAG